MEKKDSKFSWKRKDQKESGPDLNSEIADKRGEDEFMQFTGAGSGLDEAKKPVHDEPVQSESKSKAPPASFIPKREESYITKDVVINGSISAVSSIIIDGRINGNVTTDNDVTVCGSVEGDIAANSVKFSGAKIKGNISCKGNISFVKDSSVEGNVSGRNVEINGSITGNLTAIESAVIMGSAVINGDITAGLISVLEGAVIKGNVQVTKAAVSPKVTNVQDEVAAVVAGVKSGDSNLLKKYI